MLKAGVVGLANVGKSTLFNALTHANVLAANYPFATIEPNTGVVAVPDERLKVLAKMYDTEKIVPATVEFVDIAGLIAGASKGEGLGNKFLAHIRECEIICHVVRVFHDDNISHISDNVNPENDIGVVETELALADIETLEKFLPKIQREAKSGDKEAMGKVEEVARILERLRRGERNKDNVAGLQLLTAKPVVMVFNLDEKELTDEGLKSKLMEMVAPLKAVFVNAKLEAEMIDMDDADRREFLESYGVREDGLAQLAREVYATLGLQSFLTAGKKEVRAWTVGRGARAPEAAGVIHTDFQRGFVAAAVCKYDDLVKLGSEKGVKEAGLMRTEGKDYVVREGDVIEFRVAT